MVPTGCGNSLQKGSLTCSGRSSKIKQDGPKKLRIIVDLRRSGVTARTLTPQRPVLPRIGDAVESLLELMKDLE